MWAPTPSVLPSSILDLCYIAYLILWKQPINQIFIVSKVIMKPAVKSSYDPDMTTFLHSSIDFKLKNVCRTQISK